jgi:pimeloyl-ACP methyl ester carboxylesterase
MTRASVAPQVRAFVVGLTIAAACHPGTGENAGGRLQMPDGRVLEWAEYGAPGGTPVFYFHGGGSSSLEAAVYDAEAAAAGVRLIAPNRPGVGGSTPQPAFSPHTVANDVVQLAGELRLERFTVAGLSNGGMFALAVASRYPARVVRVVPINATTPLYGDTVAWQVSPTRTREAYEGIRTTLASVSPAVLLQSVRDQRRGESTDPASALPETAEPRIVALFNRIRDRVTADALFRELTLATSAWGFDPNAIQPPVEFVTGVDDPGAAYAAEWVRRLPHARLHVVPGGHVPVLAPAVRHQLMTLLATAPDGEH